MSTETFAPLIYQGVQSDVYFISDLGRVKNIKTNRFLKLQDSGYLHIRIRITKVDKYQNVRIHRAVAETFVRRPEGCNYVNHKDGDKKHNAASNLEWITQSENVLHSYQMRSEEAPLKPFVISVPVSGFRTYTVHSINASEALRQLKEQSPEASSKFFYEDFSKAAINGGDF